MNRQKILKYIIYFSFFVLYHARLAYSISPAQQQNAIIQDNQNQQRLILEKKDYEKKRNIAEIEKIGKSRDMNNFLEEDLSDSDQGGCVNLKKITISGNEIFSEKLLRKKFINQYFDKCLTKADLQNIRKKIENFYIKKGYTTTRVYFNSRTLKDKILSLIIIEGKVENLKIENNSKIDQKLSFRKKTKSFFAFPFRDSGIFNLRDFEQGVDQINRLQSYNAEIDVSPASKKGYSDITIHSKIKKPVNASISFDNLGQKSSGQNKRTVNANFDSIFGLYDNFFVSYSKDNEPNNRRKFSKSLFSSLSIPVGYWTFLTSYSASSYLTTVDDPAISYQVSGENSSKSLTLDRVLMRNQNVKTKFGSKLTLKDTKSFIEDTKNRIGTHKLSLISIYLDNIIYLKAGTINLKPSLIQSFDIFNATSDSKDITSNEAHAQFKIAKFSAYFNTHLNRFKINLPLQYTINFDSQFSENTLFGTEKFAIGGPYSIRGFRQNSISGDNGYMINNDIKIQLSQLIPESLKNNKILSYNFKNLSLNNMISKMNFSLLYDFGYVRNNKILNSAGEGYMSGAGIKFSYLGNFLNSNLTISRALNSPKFIQNIYEQQKDKESIYFDISFNF